MRRHAPKAGERAPDARVAADDGTTATLIDEFANPDGHTWGWTLLGFDGGKRDAADDLARAIAAVAVHPLVHPRLVLTNPEADANGARRLFDLDQGAHAAYGMRGLPALVLVRPDGHIAFGAPLHQTERLARFCAYVAGKLRPAYGAGEDRDARLSRR